MKRTPLKPGIKPLERKTELKRRARRYTADERAEHGRYVAARMTAWKRDEGRCQFAATLLHAVGSTRTVTERLIECEGMSDPHHIYPQERAKKEGHEETITDPANLLVLCRKHHDFVHHSRPDLAKRWGLLRDEPLPEGP